HVRPGCEAETVAFFTRNRQHFSRWDPPAPPDFYTVKFWERSVARSVEEFRADRAVRFDLHDGTVTDSRRVIGRLGFSQIFRGPFQSCILGYQVDAAYEGQGLMFEALQAAIRYMFDIKQLHRIQANHLPENARSAALLARLGFSREGLAKDYLFIAGTWRDHVLNALTNPQYDASALSR
ncbi:MAG TPA: GNAT family N-acetyltransferase, partial [Polyangiales bacterium]|nr:GNAT family N-acetyltransferase [Polyangiales bacterium]